MTPKELLNYTSVLKRYRSRFEPQWYQANQAYENNVFTGWSRATQTLVKLPFRKRFFIHLPECKKQADALENLLLLFEPLFVIYPNNIADEADRDQSKYLSRLLKQQYIDWDATNLTHKFVHNAIKYPVSFWEVSLEKKFNPISARTETVPVGQVSDAFDWLFDPRVEFEKNQIIVKKIRKPLRQIKEFKEFKEPSAKSTSSMEDWKEFIYNEKYGVRGEVGDMRNVICYQSFEKKKDGIAMEIIDMDGNSLKKAMYKDASFYPVVPLQLSSGDAYQPSFVEMQIPINRSISLAVNRLDDFVLKWLKGSYLIRSGTDVTFSDENYSKVVYDGEKPEVIQSPVLQPSMVDWQNKLFSMAERYGVNNIAGGGSPRGSQMRAAKMMDQAMKGQQSQEKTPLDNLFRAMKRVAEITLYYLSEYTDEPTDYTFRGESTDDFESKKFIGEKYRAKAQPGAVVIPHFVRNMEVEIEDVSEASMNAKREKIMELAKETQGMDPKWVQILLDTYKVGNTADIMEDLEKNKTLLDNPEFQALIAQAKSGNMPPEEHQALITLTKFLGQVSPTPTPQQINASAAPQGGGNAPKP